jgi:hypothetical protein
MPYIINTYNGTQIAVVQDGTVDNTTDVKLVGKNYAGFGEIINENFVHILESFAGANQPPNPLAGQVWYDSANRVIKFYDGNRFRIAGGAEIGPNQPVGLARGDLWWETDGEQLYVYNGEDFILIGPVSTGGEGVSQVTSRVVKDVSANDRTILTFTVNDEVMGVTAKDEFTLDSSRNPIPGFSAIKKGFNLASDVTVPGIRYHGTAVNSDQLGGIPASQYVLNSGLQSFADLVKFLNDEGLTVGNGQDLKLHITGGDQGNMTNQVGNTINFSVNTGTGSAVVAKFVNNQFLPASDNTGSIGSVATRWANIYCGSIDVDAGGTISGDLVGNVTGNVTGNLTGDVTGNINATTGTSTLNNLTVSGTLTANVAGTTDVASKVVVDSSTAREANTLLVNNTLVARDSNGDINVNIMNGTATNSQALNGASASTGATAGTIAQRDSNKDLTARKFLGTATAAQFADLAENYLADADYEVGTVLILGGEKEVTQSTAQMDSRVIGVVSENPAHLMNSALQGEFIAPVALRGRIPVKVTGPVRKGDILITSHVPGTATALTEDSAIPNAVYVIGKSIETNESSEVKLVEVVV